MGRKPHGAVAKQRHTITLDAEVVANVIEFGNRNRITGLSGAIERRVETALLGGWMFDTRKPRQEEEPGRRKEPSLGPTTR